MIRGTYRKHLIGLVKDEQLHLVRFQDTALDHIVNTAGGTDNDLGTITKGLHVLTDVGTTDTGVALDAHEVTNGDNDLLDLLSKLTGGSEDQSLASLQVGVDLLESGDGEGGSLASTGLSLSNDIVTWSLLAKNLEFKSNSKRPTLDDGHDGTLLDSRGTFETIGVDT